MTESSHALTDRDGLAYCSCGWAPERRILGGLGQVLAHIAEQEDEVE